MGTSRLGLIAFVSLTASSALAQQAAPQPPPASPAPPMPAPVMPTATPASAPAPTGAPMGASDPNAVAATAPAPEKKGPKEPKRGDFDAGGKFRFPSGPDEAGAFDSFNWVALDANG